MFGIEGFEVLILAGIVLALGVGMVGRARRRATRQRWTEAADLLGFAKVGSGFRPSISGGEGQVRATVDVYSKRSGKSQSTYTRYRIGFHSIALGLRLSRQTGWHGVLKVFGAQDIEVGDATFDANFVIKGGSTEAVRRFLTVGRMMSLNRLLAVHPGIVITDDELILETPGMERDTDTIVSTVRRMMSAANILSNDDAAAELDPIVERRMRGDVEAPVDSALIETDAVHIERALLEAEDLELAGLHEQARQVFAALESQLPADPEIAGWAERATEPVPGGSPPPDADRDPLALATRLFGDDQLSFEVTAIFDQHYRNLAVEWLGTVRRSGGLSDSKAFEGGPHSVLVVDVASIEHDLYGNSTVDAIVAFSAYAELPERGEPVRFSGRLVSVDGLTRNLYVADGRLS